MTKNTTISILHIYFIFFYYLFCKLTISSVKMYSKTCLKWPLKNNCNTFDLHYKAIIGLEKHFWSFFEWSLKTGTS